MAEKQCSRCKRTLSFDNFHRNKTKPDGYQRECKACRKEIDTNDKMSRRKQRGRKKLKGEVLGHYCAQGIACRQCGFSDIRALTLDHVNGGGSEHKREINVIGSRFYHWIKQNGFPEGYQVLCMNCQFIKRLEKGECKRNRDDPAEPSHPFRD
jgi:hypothetical protein